MRPPLTRHFLTEMTGYSDRRDGRTSPGQSPNPYIQGGSRERGGETPACSSAIWDCRKIRMPMPWSGVPWNIHRGYGPTNHHASSLGTHLLSMGPCQLGPCLPPCWPSPPRRYASFLMVVRITFQPSTSFKWGVVSWKQERGTLDELFPFQKSCWK